MKSEATGLRRQLLQAVAWNVVFTPIKFVIDVVANLIKVNVLSKAEFGAISLLSATASSIGIWADLGIDQTLPRYIPEVDRAGGAGAVRRFLRVIMAFKLVIVALALAAIPWAGGLLIERMRADAHALAARAPGDAAQFAPLLEQLDRFAWIFVGAVAALVLLGSLYDTMRTYLTSFFRQKAWNTIAAAAALLLPLLSALAVLAGYGVIGVLAAMVTTALISVAITWFYVARALRRAQPDERPASLPAGIWRGFLPYVAMSFLVSVTDYFASHYFSAYLLGLDDVAVFWLAYSLIKMVQSYVYTPMVGLQAPLFTRVRAEGDVRLARVFGTLARLLLALLTPSGVLLALFLHNFVLVQYPAYGDAIPAALTLIPFLFLEPFWGLGHNILMVHERYRAVLVSRLAALSSVPLLIALVPRLGIVGAALAIGVGRALAGLVVVVVAMRDYQLTIPWLFAGKVLLASMLAAAATAPLLLWQGQIPPGVEAIDVRLRYALMTAGLGLLALAVLVVSLRRMRLLHDDDRALLAELRHPLARRLERLL